MTLDAVLAQPGVTVAYRWPGPVTMMLANGETVLVEDGQGSWRPVPRLEACLYTDWQAMWPRALKDAELILESNTVRA